MKNFMVWGLFIMSIFGFTGCNSTPQKEVHSENRWLIVNADDFGYDEKTNNAILKCYTEGIVTSTTAYVNFPESIKMIREVHELYPDFPVGIHLNITFGKPVLPPKEIPTLVNKKNGEFWNEDQILSHIGDISFEDVKKEIHAQIEHFLESGYSPDHIDYHNHILALYTPFHQFARDEALRLNIPVRNPVPVSAYRKIKVPSGGADSAAVKKLIITGMLHPFKYIPMMKKVGVNAFIEQERITRERGIKTPDWFIDVFYENATTDIFLSIIDQLPGGVSEIMCHPGASENEVEILTNSEVKAYLEEKKIIMKNFNCLELEYVEIK